LPVPAEATHTARHPLAIYLLGLCLISGVAALIGTAIGHPTEPPAVIHAVPEWARLGWYGLLIVGAGIALAGICRSHHKVRDLIGGLLWERFGMTGLGLGAALYGLALVALDGWVSKEAGVVTLLFAFACAVRARAIGRDLGRLAAVLGGSP
jgi:hypothetical protein